MASSVSPPFTIQAPDFIAPTGQVVGAIADGVTGGAVAIQWAVGPEPDTLLPGAGYTLERADVGWSRCEAQRAVCCELESAGTSVYHWLERGKCASQGGQRLDTPRMVQVYKEYTTDGQVLTISDPSEADPTSQVSFQTSLGGYCTLRSPSCCEFPATPHPDYVLSDAAWCSTNGGSVWTPSIVGNSGSICFKT